MAGKYLDIVMIDNSEWHVPALPIAQQRATHFSTNELEYQEQLALILDDNDSLIEWAKEYMTWETLVPLATQVSLGHPEYHSWWGNEWQATRLNIEPQVKIVLK